MSLICVVFLKCYNVIFLFVYFILADRPDLNDDQGLPDVHSYYKNFLETQLEDYVRMNLEKFLEAKFLSKIMEVPSNDAPNECK